jgi:hypothetical protein
MLVAIEIATFYRLTKAYHQSLALVATPVSLFLGRFFASPHFGSISESVVVVGDPEHDWLPGLSWYQQAHASPHLSDANDWGRRPTQAVGCYRTSECSSRIAHCKIRTRLAHAIIAFLGTNSLVRRTEGHQILAVPTACLACRGQGSS